MIFADKLTKLRKKEGWSQEELAEQMDVTRQSVSKWEGNQSIPDLEKIIRLSKLFHVSTDYLLKDEIEDVEKNIFKHEDSKARWISLEDANSFLKIKETASKLIASGVFLCILSPIALILLSAMSEQPKYNINENLAIGIGMIVLLIFVSVAVSIFVLIGTKTRKYEFLKTEIFECEVGVREMVMERRSSYQSVYTRSRVLGVVLCIMALILLFLWFVAGAKGDLLLLMMVSIFLVIAGIGVVFLVRSAILWKSFEKLLKE